MRRCYFITYDFYVCLFGINLHGYKHGMGGYIGYMRHLGQKSIEDPRLWQRALVQRELSDLRSRWGARWGEKLQLTGDEHWTPGRFYWNWISSLCSFIFWFCLSFLGCKACNSILQHYLFWIVLVCFLMTFIHLSSYRFGCLKVCLSTTLTATIWLPNHL